MIALLPIILLPIFILSLPLFNALEETLEYLEETSDCVKDLPPCQSLKFTLYPVTYEDLIKQNDFFIDKSLLLKETFQENSSFVTVFYLPHKFGKSTNLQMIRSFVEIKFDSNHSTIPREDTFTYDFFTRGKILNEGRFVELLKKPPLISHHSNIIDQHLGQYPVIYLNFSNILDSDFIRSWNCIRDRVGSEFLRYSFLASRITTNESARFEKLLQYFGRIKGILDRERMVELPSSVECLGKILGEFFNKKPILLIDEYDSYLDSFLHDRYASKSEDDKVMKFFAQFYRIFGNEDVWHRVILTGTYSIYKTSLDFLRVSKTIYHALGNNMSYFFGFTENDVRLLSEHFRMSEDQLEQAKGFYKGYKMGPHYPIYNPWSILKFFQTKQLENHWEQTFQHTNFLKNLFIIDKMRNVWIGLLGDRTRRVTHLYELCSESDMWIIKNILATKVRTFALSPRKFTQTLMYLADIGHVSYMKYVEPDPARMFNVWLPNEDIRRSTFLRLRAAYMKNLHVNVPLADEAAAKLNSYMISDRPGQLFVEVMRSFEYLYNNSGTLFEKDRNFREPKPRQIAKHIVDYIGLRLRYHHEYKADPMFMSGFLLRKSNVSFVVIFNYNQSIESGEVLERVKKYTHPWTILRLETKTVKYVVISICNDSDAHMLSYTANLPPDYSPPTPICRIFSPKSSTVGTEETSLSTAVLISTAIGNETQRLETTSGIVYTQILTSFDNYTSNLDISTNYTESGASVSDCEISTEGLDQSTRYSAISAE